MRAKLAAWMVPRGRFDGCAPSRGGNDFRSSAAPPGVDHALHHIDNLPSIMAVGSLVSDNDAAVFGLTVDVGDPQVKARRRAARVRCGPGGYVADYVPFYFAPRSPMMFRIACDHRDDVAGRYPSGDDALVYLVSSVDRVDDASLGWVASDGNCAAAVTRFFADPDELANRVDWALMGETLWNDTPEDPDKMRRRMAEFLVHRVFPLSAVLGFVVRTEARQEQLRRVLAEGGSSGAYVDVRPSWYYGYRRAR